MLDSTVPHGVVWTASIVLVVAAVIDGRSLRVPNWLTYGFALAGLALAVGGWSISPWDAVCGLVLGLVLLLPLYAVGGMGAGDVKLLAGLGAWIGPTHVWHAFVASVLVGALMAVVMMLHSGRLMDHVARIRLIAGEWLTVRNPTVLSEIAAARKSRMLLLPYGIPIAAGSIAYFAVFRMLI